MPNFFFAAKFPIYVLPKNGSDFFFAPLRGAIRAAPHSLIHISRSSQVLPDGSRPVFDGLNVEICRRPAYCPNRNDEKLQVQRFRGKNDWPRSRAVGRPWDQSAQPILGISPDEAIFVTYSDHRGSKVRVIIFPSLKALQFFVIAVPCAVPAISDIQYAGRRLIPTFRPSKTGRESVFGSLRWGQQPHSHL